MMDISDTKKLLDEINAAVSSYDPIMKEQARDILMKRAFGLASAPPGLARGNASLPDPASSRAEGADQIPFNTLIEKWSPTTQADWALLGAYYFQRILGHQNVTGLQVNKELKQHGYGVTNITDSFTVNMDSNPARMLQTKKSGKSRQAKKLYLVTTAGMQYVEDRLNGVQQS